MTDLALNFEMWQFYSQYYHRNSIKRLLSAFTHGNILQEYMHQSPDLFLLFIHVLIFGTSISHKFSMWLILELRAWIFQPDCLDLNHGASIFRLVWGWLFLSSLPQCPETITLPTPKGGLWRLSNLVLEKHMISDTCNY